MHYPYNFKGSDTLTIPENPLGNKATPYNATWHTFKRWKKKFWFAMKHTYLANRVETNTQMSPCLPRHLVCVYIEIRTKRYRAVIFHPSSPLPTSRSGASLHTSYAHQPSGTTATVANPKSAGWCTNYFPRELPQPPQLSSLPLHDHTPTAATSVFLSLTHFHLASRSTVARCAATTSCCIARHLLVVASNFSNDFEESIVDIDSWLGRGFDELASERSC